MSDRKIFETWAELNGWSVFPAPDVQYVDHRTRVAWMAWKARGQVTVDDAVAVALRRAPNGQAGESTDYAQGWRDACAYINALRGVVVAHLSAAEGRAAERTEDGGPDVPLTCSPHIDAATMRDRLGLPLSLFSDVLGVHRNTLLTCAHSPKLQEALRDVACVLSWYASLVGEAHAPFYFVNWPIPEFGHANAVMLFCNGRRGDLLRAIAADQVSQPTRKVQAGVSNADQP